MGGLATRGRMMFWSRAEAIQVSPLQLLFSSWYRRSLTGFANDNEDTLGFSLLQGIKPMIETLPLEKAEGRLSEDDEQQGALSHRPDHGNARLKTKHKMPCRVREYESNTRTE